MPARHPNRAKISLSAFASRRALDSRPAEVDWLNTAAAARLLGVHRKNEGADK